MTRLLTIGHSTLGADAFLARLKAHDVTAIADVRRVPRSRRHPHFAEVSLAGFLAAAGIEYRHWPALGGLRKPRRDSPNGGWRHEGFRGYADHMETPEFTAAIDELFAFAEARLVAVMCAEAKWWQCHRQLIADALVARGAEVGHILSAREVSFHALTPFARVDGPRVTYPSLI